MGCVGEFGGDGGRGLHKLHEDSTPEFLSLTVLHSSSGGTGGRGGGRSPSLPSVAALHTPCLAMK